MWGQHRRGLAYRRAPLADHSCAVYLGSVSVSLRIGLDVWQGVMGEGVGDVAHHGGLGDRHPLGVEGRQVGLQRTSQVSHRVDGDVSDGLGGYLLVSGGGSWSRRNWLGGGGGGARRRGDVCQMLMIGRQAVVDSLDDRRVGDGGVSDDSRLDLHSRRMNWHRRGRTRRRSRSNGLRGRGSRGGGGSQDTRQRQGRVLD